MYKALTKALSALSHYTLNPPLCLTAALPSPTTSGFCPNRQPPTESQFTAGYQTFCSLYIASSPIISSAAPILATFNLGNTDGTNSQWVFKVSVESDGPDERYISTLRYKLNEKTCLDFFGRFLNTRDAGGLGESYCVVEGSGSGGKSGQGDVQVLQGKTVDKGARAESDPSKEQQWAWVQYSAFRRTGTKAQ
ncbi:hypothetical protein HBI23_217740 [Parastagonospora nodorum]|nr:hypothetical protein HBI47_194630 [Parastagonospora nodorum]KAH5632621.1 hypothetical protein HBI23_217740 [Parastagonospora nodorum]